MEMNDVRPVTDVGTARPWFACEALPVSQTAGDVAYAGYGGCIALYRERFVCPQAGWVPAAAHSTVC